jgi:hypothetical protein
MTTAEARRAGREFARAALADSPRSVREDAARRFATDRQTFPVGSPEHNAATAAIEYLTEIHETATHH